MIKVCHIITKLELGGAQQNTLYTVQHLDRRYFRPILMTGPEGILCEEANLYRDIKKYYIPSLRRELHPAQDIRALMQIRQALKQELRQDPYMPLLVHTHSSKAGIVGRWAAKLAGVSGIIHSIHGYGFHPYQSRLQRGIFITAEWLTSKITRHFIAVASENIVQGEQLGFFSPSRVSLIRSGIDIARFQQYSASALPAFQEYKSAMLEQLGLPPHKRLIGMVACFKPQKAPLDFVRALKRVADTFPGMHGILVGDGVLRPQIEALIRELRLENTLTLLGWRTDVPKIIPLCDMLVLTSLWEGLPRVCPQAMAAGVPIVATRVNGTPEAVHDKENGLLVAPGDVHDIAEKIIYLLKHPDIAEQMGKQGQRNVAEFDIHLMVQQQEQLYHSLIESEEIL